jgi:hypothetical protein
MARAKGQSLSSIPLLYVDKPGATIAPEIYQQLGYGPYEGICIGAHAPIPYTLGVRKDVLAALRDVKAPLVPWPSDAPANRYDWRGGIGPYAKRPRRINAAWGQCAGRTTQAPHIKISRRAADAERVRRELQWVAHATNCPTRLCSSRSARKVDG